MHLWGFISRALHDFAKVVAELSVPQKCLCFKVYQGPASPATTPAIQYSSLTCAWHVAGSITTATRPAASRRSHINMNKQLQNSKWNWLCQLNSAASASGIAKPTSVLMFATGCLAGWRWVTSTSLGKAWVASHGLQLHGP